MSGNSRRDRQRELVVAWQDALAAEQQAVFGYGVAGPQLPANEQVEPRSVQRAHELLRDATATALLNAGHEPPAPLVDYPLLYPAADAADALRVVITIEDACAAAWRFLYLRAASLGEPKHAAQRDIALQLRRDAQSALNASAVRASRWRVLTTREAATTAFPGT